MALILSWALMAVAILIAVWVAVLFLEIVGAIAVRQPEDMAPANPASRGRVAVLVPAHNESTGILATIGDIKAQLRPGDRLVVIADNCTDDTALVAAAAGAEVVERRDPARFGKGYALEWGLRNLRADPPEIAIIIDADCRLSKNLLDCLAATSTRVRRPVQALYLMISPDAARINQQVAEFAWRLKNWIRPLGLRALGLPCQLMGTGMAFPWEVIRSAELASGEIVEDLKLGLDLAAAGHAPHFCPSAIVTSYFPSSVGGAQSQRQRWEQGHIGLILTLASRLIGVAIARRDWGLLALALDLAVPPLVLLGLLLITAVVVNAFAALLGFSPAALIMSIASLSVFLLAIVLCWVAYGRDVLPPATLPSLMTYVVGKLALYRRLLLRGRVSRWIRTDRN